MPVDNSGAGGYYEPGAYPPGSLWLKALSSFPLVVDIPLLRDAHLPVDNAECVGSYHCFMVPTTAARAASDTINLFMGTPQLGD